MASYYWRVSYNGADLETNGIVFKTTSVWNFSPLALLTQGFLYRAGDIWFDLDPEIIQQVTWTDCACSTACG